MINFASANRWQLGGGRCFDDDANAPNYFRFWSVTDMAALVAGSARSRMTLDDPLRDYAVVIARSSSRLAGARGNRVADESRDVCHFVVLGCRN